MPELPSPEPSEAALHAAAKFRGMLSRVGVKASVTCVGIEELWYLFAVRCHQGSSRTVGVPRRDFDASIAAGTIQPSVAEALEGLNGCAAESFAGLPGQALPDPEPLQG